MAFDIAFVLKILISYAEALNRANIYLADKMGFPKTRDYYFLIYKFPQNPL